MPCGDDVRDHTDLGVFVANLVDMLIGVITAPVVQESVEFESSDSTTLRGVLLPPEAAGPDHPG